VAKDLDSFNATMRTGRQELSTLNQRVLSLTAASATVTSQVASKEAEVATLEADGEKCASEKRVLDADLAAAQVDLQLAEDAILAVCPDFDLDSIETT
jgi:chromosome segregation ATPase